MPRIKKTYTFLEPVPYEMPDGTVGEFKAEFKLPPRQSVFETVSQVSAAESLAKEDDYVVGIHDLEVEDDDGSLLKGEALKRWVLESLVFGVATARAWSAAAFRALEKNSAASPSGSSPATQEMAPATATT